MPSSTPNEFAACVERVRSGGARVAVVPIAIRVLGDQLTPVLAYRRLVSADERTAPSFLLESVEGGDRQGRHSILGARPILEVWAHGGETTITDHRDGSSWTEPSADPTARVLELTEDWRQAAPEGAVAGGLLPGCVLGGWFGSAGYDSVRYAERVKLDASRAPEDDRGLPDVAMGFYDTLVVFDHAAKLVHLVRLAVVTEDDEPGGVYERSLSDLDALADEIQRHTTPLPLGRVRRDERDPREVMDSNTTRAEHAEMVRRAKNYIHAGDIFQVVLGQRFEKRSTTDPFDVYRALRAVNPSPYMVYLQTRGSILVASSPEILCRVRRNSDGRLVVTNRPLAGTRRRGATPGDDAALERELLADPKERAEHAMLVDLGRNDVGRVAQPGSVSIDALMEVERYSHVMHISSTITGLIRDGLGAADALRAALPVGTVSGAPKVRAMEIIDELEKARRGPYGGGLGWISLTGEMDMALALRTIVVPLARRDERGQWVYHIQASGGIVADSDADAEYDETVNKAAALSRAIDLAHDAFA